MNRTVILYDANCILCRQSERLARFLDVSGCLESLDAAKRETVLARFPELADVDLLGAMLVRCGENGWVSGFFGIRCLIRQLPLLWPLLPLLYLPGMNRIGPIFYEWIARNRYKLNARLGYVCDGDSCRRPGY